MPPIRALSAVRRTFATRASAYVWRVARVEDTDATLPLTLAGARHTVYMSPTQAACVVLGAGVMTPPFSVKGK